MKRSIAAVVGLVLAMLTLAAGLAGPASAAPYCGIRWGSLAKVDPRPMTLETGPLVNVRAGRHACYDRLVLDLGGGAGGYTVQYVPELIQDGSGEVLPLRGGARLDIITTIPATDEFGGITYTPDDRLEAVDVSRFRTFRQVASLGNFEGYQQLGLGVRARLPFRVFTLHGPDGGSRLVLDVAHRW
jgi:hypothetical protein